VDLSVFYFHISNQQIYYLEPSVNIDNIFYEVTDLEFQSEHHEHCTSAKI